MTVLRMDYNPHGNDPLFFCIYWVFLCLFKVIQVTLYTERSIKHFLKQGIKCVGYRI